MRIFQYSLILIAMSVALSAQAVAEVHGNTPGIASATGPGHRFVLMDNTGYGSEVDVAFTSPRMGNAMGSALATRIVGQYVAPQGFGGYASVAGMVAEPGVGVHNLEIGGLYRRALSTTVDLGIRVGAILPTAGGDPFAGLYVLFTRPADSVVVWSDESYVRMSVSPTYHRSWIALRADLGVDLPVHKGDTLGHLNLGAAVQHGRLSASAEAQISFRMEAGHTFRGEVAGVSLRYRGSNLSPFVAVSMPVRWNDTFVSRPVSAIFGLTIPL